MCGEVWLVPVPLFCALGASGEAVFKAVIQGSNQITHSRRLDNRNP